MLSFLTRAAVRRASVTLLLTAAILIFGAYAVTQLKQELTPSIDFPVITILTSYPGAESQTVADTISTPIEQAVSGVEGLQNVQSTSTNGVSIIIASFEYGTDMKGAAATIQSNLQSEALPQGATTPQVQTFNFASQPIVQLSLTSNSETPAQLAQLARDQIIPELSKINGVFSVDVSGGDTRQLVITLDPTKLAADKISVTQVIGALQANSLTVPGGTVDQNGFAIPVVTTHKFSSAQDVCTLLVGATPSAAAGSAGAASGATSSSATTLCSAPGAHPGQILLADVATVAQSDTPTDGISRTNGQPSVGIDITKTQDANTVTVSDAVHAQLSALKLPSDVSVVTLSDQATYITQSINDLVKEGLLGAGFAVLVIFLFLFNVRSTLVSAISIPMSLLVAFIVLYVAGISLNVLTLGGLAIAIGRVVDDAVVVLENIYRHVQLGERPRKAVITATREVGAAVTASTATTLAVFAPLAFVGGLVGEFFRPFAVAVVVALAASLLVALTVVPVLASYFVRPGRRARREAASGHAHEDNTWLQRIYTPVLRWSLGHRWIVVTVALILFVLSLSTLARIPTSFLSAGGPKTVIITIAPPPGADLQAISNEASKVENVLHSDSGVQQFQTTIGGSGSTAALRSLIGGGAGNTATITAILSSDADLEATASDLRSQLSAPAIASGYSITVTDSAASNNQFQVTLSGGDTAALDSAGKQVLGVVQHEANTANATSDASAVAPTVVVTVDPTKAALYGLTAAQVGQQVRAGLTSQTAVQMTTSDINNGQPTDVVVQVNTTSLQGAQGVDLANFPIFYAVGGRAGSVPLGGRHALDPAEPGGGDTRRWPAVGDDQRRHHRAEHRQGVGGPATEDQRPESAGEHHSQLRRHHVAAEHWVQRSDLRDARRDRAGLRAHGADLRVADRSVHSALRAATGGHRRVPGAAADRANAEHLGDDRPADAGGHRGDERHRAARHGEAAREARHVHA